MGERVLTERGLDVLVASRRVHFDPQGNGGTDYIAVSDLRAALTNTPAPTQVARTAHVPSDAATAQAAIDRRLGLNADGSAQVAQADETLADSVADGQTFSGVRCELCGVVRMNAMYSRDGVVRCQDHSICEQVVALVAGARSTYDDLIEAGWKPAAHVATIRADAEQANESLIDRIEAVLLKWWRGSDVTRNEEKLARDIRHAMKPPAKGATDD